MLSNEEANERMEDADENRDGKMSWDEYLQDAYGMGEDEPNPDIDDQVKINLLLLLGLI